MVNMLKLVKQAQSMQKNIEKLQAELAERSFEFTAGGGSVKAVVKGNMNVERIEISPAAVDPQDVEMLQDMLLSAVNEALQKGKALAEERMGALTGGLGLPPGLGF